jgi:hypothetical protein
MSRFQYFQGPDCNASNATIRASLNECTLIRDNRYHLWRCNGSTPLLCGTDSTTCADCRTSGSFSPVSNNACFTIQSNLWSVRPQCVGSSTTPLSVPQGNTIASARPTSTLQNTSSTPENGNGLSLGATVGIITGGIFLLIILSVGGVWFYIKKKVL